MGKSDEIDEMAYKQVREFIRILREEHNINIEDIKDANKYYQNLSKWSTWFAKVVIGSIITTLAGGAAFIFAQGAKAVMALLGGQT